MRKLVLSIFLFILFGNLSAQDTLSLEEAIRIGIENNFQIVLAKNNLEIAKNNNTWETVMPSVGVTGSETNNATSSKQVPFSGPVREGNNLQSTNLSFSALMNWKIFDGFNMFVTKDKMEEFERIGETATRMALEDVVSRIKVTYYGIILQKEMLGQLREALAISVERKKIIDLRYSIGSASQLAKMQAQADLNADSSALIGQEVLYKNAQADLNRLLMREASATLFTKDSLLVDKLLIYDVLRDNVKSQNSELLLARQNEKIAALSINQAKSNRYPQLNLVGGYSYNRSTAEIGFAALSRNYGPVYGATLSWNLYGGGATNRTIQNAKIQKMSQEAQRKDLEMQIDNELYKLYNQYQLNQNLVQLEGKNLKITEQNVIIAIEKYKTGSYTDLELREVQKTFLEASSRLLSAIYLTKQQEVDLLKWSGQLIE